MPKVSVYDVDAPEEVSPGDSLNIKVKVLHTSLPWWLGGRLIGVVSFLNEDGEELFRKRHIFKPWWFWGYKTFSFNIDELPETTMFSLDVGWTE